jgi:hypothetical protein
LSDPNATVGATSAMALPISLTPIQPLPVDRQRAFPHLKAFQPFEETHPKQ